MIVFARDSNRKIKPFRLIRIVPAFRIFHTPLWMQWDMQWLNAYLPGCHHQPPFAQVAGAFFWTGLASILCKPCRVAFTNGELELVGDVKPAVECSQAKALHASSAADLDCTSTPICWRYRAIWAGFAGSTGNWCWDVHNFHLLKAPKYFLAVESARLWSTVLGSFLASFWSTGSWSSSNSDQGTWENTSVMHK